MYDQCNQILLDSCRFVDVSPPPPPWWEDRSLVHSCCWVSPVTVAAGCHQWSLSLVLWDSWPCFTVSNLRHSQPGGPGSCIYLPEEQHSSVISSAIGFASLHMWAEACAEGGCPVWDTFVIHSLIACTSVREIQYLVWSGINLLRRSVYCP
jgi:hypothetical protein